MKNIKQIMVTITLLSITQFSLAGGGVQLYGVNPFGGDAVTSGGLYSINQTTGEYTSVVSITESGDFKETIAMALDTTDNKTVYVVFEADGTSDTRTLGTMDLNSGVITAVGLLSDKVAGIAFDANGELYGLTGNGGTDSSTLFSIDKATAVMTNLVAMDGSNDDGEALGFNFDDGLMYRSSGNPTNEMTSINLNTLAIITLPVTSTDDIGEGVSLLYDIDTGLFLGSDRDEQLTTLNPSTGVESVIGSDAGGNYLRGFMFFPSKQDLIFYDGFDDAPPPPVR